MGDVNELLQVDIVQVLLGMFMIISACISTFAVISKFLDYIGKPLKWIKSKNADHELLLKTMQDLSSLQSRHVNDVDKSVQRDEEIKSIINDICSKVDLLSTSLNDMREIQDKDKLSEYKDRIGQIYRFYHTRKYSDEEPIPWMNSMEKEVLKELIEQYESHGGRNSFVHTIVEPEMQTWKVVD